MTVGAKEVPTVTERFGVVRFPDVDTVVGTVDVRYSWELSNNRELPFVANCKVLSTEGVAKGFCNDDHEFSCLYEQEGFAAVPAIRELLDGMSGEGFGVKWIKQ